MAAPEILFLLDPSPKVNQIIRNTWITILSNMTAIQPMVHPLLCPQAFWVAIFENDRLWLGTPKKYMGRIAQSHTR